MHSLRQIWRNTAARIANTFTAAPRAASPSPVLERELTAVARDNQSLTAGLQRFQAESERARSEEICTIARLEDAEREAASARTAQARHLSELERRIVELEAGHELARGAAASFDSSLTIASQRLAELDGQLRDWRTRVDEQAKSLSDALTRQEATAGDLATLRHESQQQARTLESSLTDVSRRLAAVDDQTRNWQLMADEHARAFETVLSGAITRQEAMAGDLATWRDASGQQFSSLESSLADAATRLETTDGQLRNVEKKLDLEHRLYLHTVREVQNQVHVQDQRLGWTMMAAVCAILLGAVGGGILIWDVQKNAGVLTAMNQDLRRLMASMGQLPATLPPVPDRTGPAAGNREPVADKGEPSAVEAQQVIKKETRPTDKQDAANREPVTASVAPQEHNPRVHTMSTSRKSPELEQAPAVREKGANVNSYIAGSAFQRAREVQDRQQTRSGGMVSYLKNLIGTAGNTAAPATKSSAATAGEDGGRALDMLPNGVGYRAIKSGYGRSPKRGDKVVVNYLEITPDGVVLQETYSSGKPATLDMQSLDPGVQGALLKMSEGAEWEVYVPAASAEGTPSGDTTAAEHIYLIELLKVVKDRDKGG